MIEINGVKYNLANISYAYVRNVEDKYQIVYVVTSGGEIITEFDNENERDNAFEALSF